MEAASFFANRKFLFIKIISKQKRYSGQREIAPKIKLKVDGCRLTVKPSTNNH
jgi:hypothetical protein